MPLKNDWIERSEGMQRKATAIWRGDLKSGKGSLSTESTVLKEAQYSFSTRFENGIGTNPEELLAATHAGCFAMAVSAQLGRAGLKPEKLEATATVTFLAHGPGASQAKFDAPVQAPATACPVTALAG